MVQRQPTELYRAIKHAIKTADPMGLLEWGAPNDEYDDEAWLILDRLNDGRDDLRTIVRDVFRNQFDLNGVDDQLATLIDAIKDALNRVSESE